MKRILLSIVLVVPLACATLASVGCSGPDEVKQGSATAANFGPGVGVNEDGEELEDGLVYLD